MKCRDESHGWALNATEETRNGCQYFEHGESAGGVETVGSDQFASTQTFFFPYFHSRGKQRRAGCQQIRCRLRPGLPWLSDR